MRKLKASSSPKSNQLWLSTLLLSSFLYQSASAVPQSVLDRVRNGYFMIAGFPSTIISNGPPQDGLISLVDTLSRGAQSVAVANGVSSCESVPASGTFNGTISIPTSIQPFFGNAATVPVTVSFATPVVLAPTGFSGAGSLFQKRANLHLVSDATVLFSVEFNCNTNEFFAAFSLPGDSIAASTRDINLYIHNVTPAVTADFLMTVTRNSRATVVDSEIARLKTTDGTHFDLWDTNITCRRGSWAQGGGSDQYSFGRSVIKGNSSTKTGSVYTKMSSIDVTAAATNDTAACGMVVDSSTGSAAVSSHDLKSAPEPNAGVSYEKSGCVSLTATATDPADGTYCAGDGTSLTAPAAPSTDASGDFSVNYVRTSLISHMHFAN